MHEFLEDLNSAWDSGKKQDYLESTIEEIKKSFLLTKRSVVNMDFSEIPNNPGLYAFFYEDFNFESYDHFFSQWCPDLKQKGLTKPTKERFAIEQHEQFPIFYLGKRLKIRSRIKEHICHKEGNTFSLKLGRDCAIDFRNKMEVGFWEFKDYDSLPKEIAYMVLSTLERKLFDYLSPRVGNK